MVKRENVQLAIAVIGMTASLLGAFFTALIATNLHLKLHKKLGT
jgi:hypothetical protein